MGKLAILGGEPIPLIFLNGRCIISDLDFPIAEKMSKTTISSLHQIILGDTDV